jgi:outer membrane protein OmpA-like peptidoglycan-associated protein
MKFRFLVRSSFLFFTTNLLAQNLVPNPSFEELTSCPVDVSVDSTGIAKARHWFTTDKNNTPDLFNECTGKGEHYAMLGTQNTPAKSGKGYAGIWCFSERLEVRLKSPLVKNKTYRVQMYVYRAADSGESRFLYPGFYFCFSRILIIKKNIDDSLINKKVIGIVKNDTNESNHSKWELFSAYYTARGGENYFAFGGLNTSKAIDKIYYEEYHHTIPYYYPYYYIDDVSVEEDTTVSTSQPLAFQGKLVTGQKLTLKNIFFETSKANLLSTSNNELDALVKALQSNQLVSLNISGYTDSTGNEMSNIELSTKRAEAVRNYIVRKGIALNRINCKGFGSANAVADNKTEEGKKSNRRVEIEVTGIH